MFFNPLFLQITNCGQPVSQLNIQKMNSSSYLFSDIIKVYVENSETANDNASTQNLSGTNAAVLSGFVRRLFNDKLNLDELQIPSGLNKPENNELILKSTIHFNKNDVHQLITKLIDGSSDFNGKISLILDETDLPGSIEELKESPENLITLLKSGGTLLIEDAELAKDNGLLITIVEPGVENAEYKEIEPNKLIVNTSSDASEQTGDYGIKLSLINLTVDNTTYKLHMDADSGRKLNIILNNPPAEYYSSAKLSSKDISVLAKMSGDNYKQVPFKSTTTAVHFDPPADTISMSPKDHNTTANVQEIQGSDVVSDNVIVNQRNNPETEQIKVNGAKPSLIADYIKPGDPTQKDKKTTSASIPSQMNDLESKVQTISGNVNKEVKIEENILPHVHPPQKSYGSKSGPEVSNSSPEMKSASKNTGEKIFNTSDTFANVTRSIESTVVDQEVKSAINTKIVSDKIKSKDYPEPIQTSQMPGGVNNRKNEEVKNISGDIKINSTMPGIKKEIRANDIKMEPSVKQDYASIPGKTQPKNIPATNFEKVVPLNYVQSSSESKTQVQASSPIEVNKENILPEEHGQETSANAQSKSVDVDNVMRTDKNVKINYNEKTIGKVTTEDQKIKYESKNILNDQINAEVKEDEQLIANEIRTVKEKEKPLTSQNIIKESPTPNKVEVVQEDVKIISTKPVIIPGTKSMKDVIAKGLKEINTGITDQLTPKNSNQVINQLKQPVINEFVDEKAFSRNDFEQKSDSVKSNGQNIDINLQNQETSFSEHSEKSDNSFLNQERNDRPGFVKEFNTITVTKSPAQNDDKPIPVIEKQNIATNEMKNVSEESVKHQYETGSIKKEHPETVIRSEANVPAKEKIVNEIPFQHSHSKIIKAAEIVKEMSKFIQDGSKNSIVLKLDPENLGSMKIQLDIVNKMVNAQIEVDNEVTQKLVENNLPQLYNTLNQSGIQVNVMNITLNNFDQKNTKNLFTRKKNPGSDTERIVEDKSTVQEKNMGYNTYEYLI